MVFPCHDATKLPRSNRGQFDVFYIPVRSVSRPVWEALPRTETLVRVLGRFRRVMDLLVGDEVIALALPAVGNGPFHIVVGALPSFEASEARGMTLSWAGNVAHLGRWRLDFGASPALWNPCPDWGTLRLREERLSALRALAREAARACEARSPFVALLLGESMPQIAALERALARQDTTDFQEAVAAIAGLGPGLTPAGDDFLAGVMVASRLVKDAPYFDIPALIFEAASARTNRISRAFLRAAREGQVDERWHRLLDALAGPNSASLDPHTLEQRARAVLAFGASSGLDMLAGFLWFYAL
ncbi:MAG: DUF2877 domain-containing protein [Anaerolineales bacterium]